MIRNFRNVDWSKFQQTLEGQLKGHGDPKPIREPGELNRECSRLISVLQKTIQKEVPTTNLGPKSKCWWTKELTQLRREASKLGRITSKKEVNSEDPIHAVSKKAKKAYEKAIKYNKKHHWRDWLEKATDPDIWTAHRYISAPASDGGTTRIPTLKVLQGDIEVTASTNEDKSKMLAKTFFPARPLDAETIRDEQVFPPPVCGLDAITWDQIRRHLNKLKPYKAPGPDNIPNIILTKCADLLIHRLYHIFTAITKCSMYYDPWKQFTMVVLHKPSKPKYSIPKAYRPIALLNTTAKLLSAIIAEQLMYYTEKFNLLPSNHFRGRACRTASDAVHLLVHRIKGEWRKGKVVAVLFLDIKGAFPNAVNRQLLNNLQSRKVPKKIVQYVANMLRDRSTTLQFNDHISAPIALDNGIGQGDPLSIGSFKVATYWLLIMLLISPLI